MRPNSHQKVNFQAILDALLDQAHSFPPVYLHHLSDLNPEDLQKFRQTWPQVHVERRRNLLEDLEELADSDTLVSFEGVGKLSLIDPDPQVRSLGIRLLWDTQDRKLIATFSNLMETDPDKVVRSTAATGLGIYIYLGELEELPTDLLKNVEENLLKAATQSESELVRRRALESLGYSSRPEVPHLIQEAFDTGKTEWIESALFAMGRTADEAWESIILRMITDDRDTVQFEAIRASGELGLRSARDPLFDLLEEAEDEDTRSAIIWSLSQIGGQGVQGTLEALLEEAEEDEADFIEEALENLNFTTDIAGFNMLAIDPQKSETHIQGSDDLANKNPEDEEED